MSVEQIISAGIELGEQVAAGYTGAEQERAMRALIAAAIADARREGAEQMREACAVCAAESLIESEGERMTDYVALQIRAMPLPTGPRQAVRLTNQQIISAMGAPEIEVAQAGAERVIAIGHAIEAAVLAAIGLVDGNA